VTDVNLRTSGAGTAHLNTLRVAELQALAGELGLQGASKLRKGELVEAISEIQSRNAGSAAPVSAEVAAEAAAPAVAEAPRKRASRRVTTATAAPAGAHVSADGALDFGIILPDAPAANSRKTAAPATYAGSTDTDAAQTPVVAVEKPVRQARKRASSATVTAAAAATLEAEAAPAVPTEAAPAPGFGERAEHHTGVHARRQEHRLGEGWRFAG